MMFLNTESMNTETPSTHADPASHAATQSAPSEHTFRLPDGSELFYRAWLPTRPARRAVMLFHRGHEHSGRLADVVEELALKETAVFAWDARGHGRSPGRRGWAPSFACLVADMDAFVRGVAQQHDIALEDIAVLAHSVGAVVAATWVHDYAPPIRALVLATPALRVKLYVPFAIPALRLWRALRRGKPTFVKSYVKPHMLTHDADQARRYAADPLITRDIAVNVLLGLYDAGTRLLNDAAAIRVPTLVLAGEADWVVRLDVQRRFFDRLGAETKAMHVFDGMYHDILHERERSAVLGTARDFLRRAFATRERPTPLLDADRHGPSREAYLRLLRPLPRLAPRNLGYRALSLGMKTVGRLSRGIRLGWRTGFDSGQSLDYVYENRARGALGVGRLFDRLYLDGAGWRGIRQRKVHVEAFLDEAIDRLEAAGRPVHLLDVAAGAGRYALETLARRPRAMRSARLRDLSPANVEAGRRLASEMGLDNVVFEEVDAFNAAALRTLEPRPTVALVSGLYELFPDNDRVLTSLRGLGGALGAGGYLIYTNQPWHPQLELIARALTNREGVPWVMRCRSQEEMDDLVRAAGFQKIDMAIDEAGIFTVSLAKIGEV